MRPQCRPDLTDSDSCANRGKLGRAGFEWVESIAQAGTIGVCIRISFCRAGCTRSARVNYAKAVLCAARYADRCQ